LRLKRRRNGRRLRLQSLSTQDSVAASLVKDYGIPTFAIRGEDSKLYYKHLNAVLDFHPQIYYG